MMENRIEVESLVTIADHLKALAEINDSIAGISYQLNYSNGDNAWRRRAGMALHKCKSIRVAIQCKLAVLRQEEKEKNAELHQRHSDFLVKELMAVVPLETFQECDQRAKKKAEGIQ